MNICYVATTTHVSKELNEGIGSSVHCMAIAKELVGLGHKVVLVSDFWEWDRKKELIDGVKIYRLKRGIVKSGKELKEGKIGFLFKPLRIFSDIFLGIEIAGIAKRESCNCILERSQSRNGWIVSLITGLPLFVEIIDSMISKASLGVARKIFAYTDVFFDNDQKKKLVIVKSGYDHRIMKPLKSKIEYDICYVGSFKEWDGLENLVGAVERLKLKGMKLRVLLVGNETKRKKIGNLIASKNLDSSFKFTGNVEQRGIPKLIAKCRLCVAPYDVRNCEKGRLNELGFYFSPLKVIEYMACGKPLVATDYKLIRGIVGDKRQLFREGNIEELALKIEKLLKMGKSGLIKIGERNYKKAKGLTWKKVAETIDDELRRIL